jgi:hypothetical protein
MAIGTEEYLGNVIERAPIVIVEQENIFADLADFLLQPVREWARASVRYFRAAVAAVEHLFVKEIIIAPEGSLRVPAGENQMTGQNTIPAGALDIFIPHSRITETSKVFLTALTRTSHPLAVTEKIPGSGFRVSLREAEAEDVPFDWLVVNTYEATPEATVILSSAPAPAPEEAVPPNDPAPPVTDVPQTEPEATTTIATPPAPPTTEISPPEASEPPAPSEPAAETTTP